MDVSLDDVSNVIRLVREVCDYWDDPQVWRRCLLEGACRLIHGHVGIMMADYQSEHGWFGGVAVTSIVGLSPSMLPIVHSGIARVDKRRVDDISENVLPGVTTMYADMERQGWVTASSRYFSDEVSYHASPWYQEFYKQIDCDDYVVSVRLVDVPRRPEAITINRPQGATLFGAREVALLKLLHDEVAPMVGVRLATEEHLSRDGLSRRLRETLSLLLDGQSEKQVASALGLGQATIHDYVVRLYEHFHVCSRAELLAYFIRRKPAVRTLGPGGRPSD